MTNGEGIMSTTLQRMTWLAGILGGALVLTTATAAHAADIQYYGFSAESQSDGFGNGNFGANYNWYGAQQVYSVNVSNGSWRMYNAVESFETSATLFGRKEVPIDVLAESTADGTTNDSLWDFTAGGYSTTSVMGTTIYFATASTCTPSANHVRYCTAFDQSLSRTLFSGSASFTVGFVPVTVSASVVGNVHAGQSTTADASRYLGIKDSVFESQNASMNAGAYVQANLSAFAGISGVLAVGVNGSFKLIDIAVSPTSSQRTVAWSGGYGGTWSNKLPFALNTMSGSVDVWAQISPFWKPSTNLISWSGLSWNYLAVDDTSNFDTNSGFTF
jgi:hypothetical protein